MAVNDTMYRELVNAGLPHAAAIILADPESATRKAVVHQDLPTPPSAGATIYWQQDFRSGQPAGTVLVGPGIPAVGDPLVSNGEGSAFFSRDERGLFLNLPKSTSTATFPTSIAVDVPETLDSGLDVTAIAYSGDGAPDTGSIFTIADPDQTKTRVEFVVNPTTGGISINVWQNGASAAATNQTSFAAGTTVKFRCRLERETGRVMMWVNDKFVERTITNLKFGSRLIINRAADRATGDSIRIQSIEISAPKPLT